MNTFSDKRNLREVVAISPALKEMLKEFLHVEGKLCYMETSLQEGIKNIREGKNMAKYEKLFLLLISLIYI